MKKIQNRNKQTFSKEHVRFEAIFLNFAAFPIRSVTIVALDIGTHVVLKFIKFIWEKIAAFDGVRVNDVILFVVVYPCTALLIKVIEFVFGFHGIFRKDRIQVLKIGTIELHQFYKQLCLYLVCEDVKGISIYEKSFVRGMSVKIKEKMNRL